MNADRSRPRKAHVLEARWLSLLLVLFCVTPSAAGEGRALRRAFVPAQRPDVWPAGDWEPVPRAELDAFVRDQESGRTTAAPAPLVERAVYHAELVEPLRLGGRFEASVRRPNDAGAFLVLGSLTGAFQELAWSDGPVVWGAAPDGNAMLFVDRPSGALHGKWALAGTEVHGQSQFELRLFPAAASRVEILLPADCVLRCSSGVVLPATDADGRRLWVVELGQRFHCTCYVERPAALADAAAVQVERSILYSMRPDGCRVQADFSISAQARAPAELAFVLPGELENVSATSAAGTSLTARHEHVAGESRLIVPLAPLSPGRLGTVRVSGDLPLREETDWQLPVVRLEHATTISGARRVHVDRPLRLHDYQMRGLRQSGIHIDDVGGDWSFEELAADAALSVRISRPQASLAALVVTAIEQDERETRFRALAQLQARGGSVFRADLRLPGGWGVIDVATPGPGPSSVSDWSLTEARAESLLQIEFRHSLGSQTPRLVLISGKRITSIGAPAEFPLFPHLADGDDSRLLCAIRDPASSAGRMLAAPGAERVNPQQLPPEWLPLLATLKVDRAEAGLVWFLESSPPPAGAITHARSEAVDETTATPVPAAAVASPADTGGAPAFDLHLTSDIGGRGADWHLHRARYRFLTPLPAHSRQFRLPDSARLDAVYAAGRAQNALSEGNLVKLPDLSAGTDSIEVRYRTPARHPAGWLQRRLEIPLLDWQNSPQRFEWTIHLPRTEQLADVHVPLAAVAPAPHTGWAHRWFGPLARGDQTPWFNPFSAASWNSLLSPSRRAPATDPSTISLVTLKPPSILIVDVADVRNTNLAGWLALLASLLAVCLIRLRFDHHHPVVWAAAAALVLAAAIAPIVSASLCGGALAGALIAAVLPRSWIARRDVLQQWSAPTSVAMRRSNAAIGAGLFIALLLRTSLRAQGEIPPSPTGGENTVTPAADADVLIPSGPGAAPDSAWLSRRLLPLFEAWKQLRPANPPYLLQAARYEFTAQSDLRVELQVVVFDSRPRVSLLLPFGRLTVRNPDDCVVDGAPTQIRPAADSPALLVQLAGTSREDPYRVATVVLWLRPDAAKTAGWQFDVMPVPDSTLTLPPAASPEEQLVAPSHAPLQSDDQGRITVQLGARTNILLTPASSPRPPLQTELVADAISLVDVHPLRLRVRTQLIPAEPMPNAAGLAPRLLRLVLPGRADVREVAAAALRSYSVRHPAPDAALLELQLDRPLRPGRPVHLDFTLPVVAADGELVIPQLTFLEEGSLKSHRIGLRPAPGLIVKPDRARLDRDRLREVPPEMFHAGLQADMAWPAPDAVFFASTPASIPVTVSVVEAVRSVALVQTLLAQDDMLRWQATATIDLSGSPVYRHEFTLSPAVRLEDVSLLQDGARRLLDWARHGERLVLYLSADRTGRQEVRLAGSVSLVPAEPTPLPRLSLSNARLTASELIVQNNTPHRLELLDPAGAILPPGPAPQDSSGDTLTVRRFSLPETTLPAACRLVPSPEPLAVDLLIGFERRDGEWWMMAHFNSVDKRPITEPVRLGAPRDAADRIVCAPPAALTRRRDAGNLALFELHPSTPAPADRFVLSVPLELAGRRDWTPPRLTLTGVRLASETVVVPPLFPFVPDAAGASPIDGAAPIDQLLATLAPQLRPPGTAVYRWLGDDRRFIPRADDDIFPEVHLIETTLWRTPDGGAIGTSTFWITPRQPRGLLRLPWPEQVQLRALCWDNRLLEPTFGADHSLLCRISGTAGSLHRLQLEWEAPSGEGALAAATVWRPVWSSPQRAPEFVTVIPRPGFYEWPRQRQSRAEVARAHLEAMLALFAAAATEPVAEDLPRVLTREIDDALATFAGDPPAERFQPLIDRWAALHAQPAAADPKQPSIATAMEHPPAAGFMLFGTAVQDSRTLLIAPEAGATDIRLWTLHRGLSVMAACIAVVIGLVLFARITLGRPRSGESSVRDGTPLGVLFLGIVWWVWLKGGLIGIALIIAAAALQWNAWRRTRPIPPEPVR